MGDSMDGVAVSLPVHSVYISAFSMDTTEVTKAQWDEVKAWGATNGYTDLPAGGGKAANHPVQTVNWYAAVRWCNARSQKEGLTPCYTVTGEVYKVGASVPDCNWAASGYRLPTEAEWEKAARGGASGRRFPWGVSDTISHSRANYYAEAGFTYDQAAAGYHPTYGTGALPYTSPAGAFAANGYGLYDMAGNVWEWCWDRYGAAYYTNSPASDPQGPSSGTARVLRGGSWYVNASYNRVEYRHQSSVTFSDTSFGFRPVRRVP
jgi:formylglycine-generating enzyme required for sulfatase activity